MDFAVSFPARGVIHVKSRALFGDADHPDCRRFLECVFRAKEVSRVEIRDSVAELRYCPDTHQLHEVVDRVAAYLNGHPPHPNGPIKGTDGANGHLYPTSGYPNGLANVSPQVANGHPQEEKGQVVGKSKSATDRRGVVRYFRHETVVSGWEVKQESPGRLKLKNAVLYRKAELCQAIERELMSVLGVDKYKTSSLTSTVVIDYDPRELTKAQVIEIVDSALENAEHPTALDKLDLHLPICSASLPLAAIAQFAFPPLLPVAAAVFAYTSIPTFKEARSVLFEERRLGVDVLDAIVVVGCLGTMSIFPGAVLCWCLGLGKVLVKRTQDNSKKLLLNAVGKQPRYGWLYRDGVEVQISMDRLEQDDIIVVNTGEVVPVDGVVVEGMAMIDQHALTGESTPSEKGVGDRVFASTLMVARQGVRLGRSRAATPPRPRSASKILQRLGRLQAPHLAAQGGAAGRQGGDPDPGDRRRGPGHDGPVRRRGRAQQRLRHRHPDGRASGHALLAGALRQQGDSGQGRPGPGVDERDRHRALRQDGHPHPRRRPEVGRIIAANGFEEDRILQFAAAAERRFHHPIAMAILHRARELDLTLPATDDTQYKVGYGITVHVEGHEVRVGSKRFMETEGVELPDEVRESLEASHLEGHTVVMVSVDGKLGGALELQAAVRPEIPEIVAGLRARGIKHLAIISGDHDAPTRKLAESLGMDRYFAQVLPADKADYVEKLQKEGRKVCFVGDGINDSIALKKANVSISLRGASSIATDTAHIVFLEEGLAKLCELRDISRNLDRNVKRSWNLILAPNIACIAGVFTMGFGIMASVVTNNVAALAALGNGMLPLRKIAQIEAERRHKRELRPAHAPERNIA